MVFVNLIDLIYRDPKFAEVDTQAKVGKHFSRYLYKSRDSPDSPDIKQNRETPDNRTYSDYRDSPIKCI